MNFYDSSNASNENFSFLNNEQIYKKDDLVKALKEANNTNELIELQNLIFNQLHLSFKKNFIIQEKEKILTLTEDTSNTYMFLTILSDTITNYCTILNENFYSKWFYDLIMYYLKPVNRMQESIPNENENDNESVETNDEDIKNAPVEIHDEDDMVNSINPVLAEICLIIITKLSLSFDLKKLTHFFNPDFIDIYFNLLKTFNSKRFYHVQSENDDDPIVSLRIQIIRLISLISSDEDLIMHCIDYMDQIIFLLSISKNETLIQFYSSFILYGLKFANKVKDKVIFKFDLPVDAIFKLIKSENLKIKLINIEIFNQLLLLPKIETDVDSLSVFIEKFIELLDYDSFEVISLSLRIFETIYSINSDFEYTEFHNDVLNKLIELLHHRSSTVRYSAIKCIISFVSNYKNYFNSLDELIEGLLLNSKKGRFDVQVNVAIALSIIVNKFDQKCLPNLPIQKILDLFTHIFLTDNFDVFESLFDASCNFIDTVMINDMQSDVLTPLINFDFQSLAEDFPNQVETIESKLKEIKEREPTDESK